MPTQITTFAEDELKMRYREPFGTEGLNAKLAVNTAPGVYRGFRLATSGSNDTVTLASDLGALDHAAVYQTETGYSLTIRKTGGDFSLDLASLVDAGEKTWVIALTASYSLGTLSASGLAAYELSPTDDFTGAPERDELVVLGTVTIPAGGGVAIPAANIRDTFRTMAWRSAALEAKPWRPVIKNANFEFGSLSATDRELPFWVVTGAQTWSRVSTDAVNGIFSLQPTVVTGPFTASLLQRVGAEVVEGGRVLVEFSKRALLAATGGAASVRLTFKDDDGTDLTPVDVLFDVDSVDANFVPVTQGVVGPVGSSVLDRVEVYLDSLTYAAGGAGMLLDAVQIWVEGAASTGWGSVGVPVDSSQVLLRSEAVSALFTDEAALLTYDHTTPSGQGTVTLGGVNVTKDPRLALKDLVVDKVVNTTVIALTDAATIAVNAALSNKYKVTLTATRVLGNPTNVVEGDTWSVVVIQDGTGGWNLTYEANYDWGDEGAPDISTDAAGEQNIISFYALSPTHVIATMQTGYSA